MQVSLSLRERWFYIPPGTFGCLPKESWVQCFFHPTVLRTDMFVLQSLVTSSESLISSVRQVIQNSEILNSFQIADCLDAMVNVTSDPDEEF